MEPSVRARPRRATTDVVQTRGALDRAASDHREATHLRGLLHARHDDVEEADRRLAWLGGAVTGLAARRAAQPPSLTGLTTSA